MEVCLAVGLSRVARNAPHHIDVHVGRALRRAREEAGLTQAALAAALGVSFQQLQKYENAGNRISAGRLWTAGRALQRTPNDFFPPTVGRPAADTSPTLRRDTARLVRHFARIRRPRIRRAIISLVRAIAARYDSGGGRVHPPPTSPQSRREALGS